jgi:hypothetical protein
MFETFDPATGKVLIAVFVQGLDRAIGHGRSGGAPPMRAPDPPMRVPLLYFNSE